MELIGTEGSERYHSRLLVARPTQIAKGGSQQTGGHCQVPVEPHFIKHISTSYLTAWISCAGIIDNKFVQQTMCLFVCLFVCHGDSMKLHYAWFLVTSSRTGNVRSFHSRNSSLKC